ncbi:MAG: class IV adenylate cyclase [Clostridia bacterium]|nr:class IV adenylate cyclase [Clostridia bacterium]
MQEIEIKFKIENVEHVKEKLRSAGCQLSEELHQKDTVFVSDLSDTKSDEGKIFTRIRSVNGVNELNLKKQSKDLINSKEIEFEVSDYDKVYDFLNTLGLKKWVTVEKIRVTGVYQGFNICIDNVKYLGNFIEIEMVTEDENIKLYEEKILEIALELGIDINHRVNSHYDTMLNELNH